MSTRELTRAGVLARVAAGTLRLRSAAVLMAVSYRQAKRLVWRYRAEGAKGLKHRSAGRRVECGPRRERSGSVSWRWCGRNTAGRWTSGLDRRWRRSTWRARMACTCITTRCGGGCWRRACGAARGSAARIAGAASGWRTSASWCSSMAVFIPGSSSAVHRAAC